MFSNLLWTKLCKNHIVGPSRFLSLARFWWDEKPDKRKTSWVAWEKLTVPKSAGGLGFRDLERCNDSLLAKLGWRLLKHPESLLFRMLLGKYCQNSSFMECSLPSRPSHGWRSIIAGRNVLKKGLGWLNANGESVSIWNDPWLSLSQPFLPFGLPGYERIIQQLPMPCARGADKLVWLPVKSGVYSTRSGYGITSVESIPVGIQLVRRNISSDMACRRCGSPESTTHMLFHCEFAVQVWNLAPIKHCVVPHGHSMMDALRQLAKATCLPPTGLYRATLFAWICWHIWKARNQLLFKNNHFSAMETITRAVQDALAWQTAQLSLPKPRRTMAQPPSPPIIRSGYYCFVDAAWLEQASMAGSGWVYQVAMDLEKEPMTHSAGCIRLPSALSAEAWALKSAMQHALELGRTDLLLLSDSKALIDSLNSDTSINEIYGLLEEIRSLQWRFQSISFRFISRVFNDVADSTAKLFCVMSEL